MFQPNDFMAIRLNDEAPAPAERTVLVFGAPRGGTTMIASSLSDLGAPMFHRSNCDFEDDRLAGLLQQGESDQARSIIAERNRDHAVWGFKRPRMSTYIEDVLPLFRNPRVVVVVKNPLSIANRRYTKRYPQESFQASFSHVMAHMARIEAFVRNAACPTLLVSFEGALADREQFLRTLAEFSGLDPARIPVALQRQPGNRAAYLERRSVLAEVEA